MLLRERDAEAPRAASGPPVVVERVEDASRFEALREEWNDALRASASDCPFLTWEWLFTWWKHFSHGRRLLVLAVRSGGRLTGFAPLTVRSSPAGKLHLFDTVELLGTGSVGSDYLDVVARRGAEPEVVDALMDAVPRGRVRIVLGQLRRSESVAAELARRLGERGWRLESHDSGVCPHIDLSSHSWESYLGTLGSSHRYNFRRRLRNLRRRHEVALEEVSSEEQRRDVLESLFALHDDRWSERGGSDAFYSSRLLDFHRDASRLFLERGWLRLYRLALDGEPAASVYAFRYGDVVYFYQSGFDPRHRRDSVGLVALGASIRKAIEEGASEYDLLHGEEDYKFRWAGATRALERLELYPPDAAGLVLERAVAASRSVRSAARRLLPRRLLSAQSEWRKRLAARAG